MTHWCYFSSFSIGDVLEHLYLTHLYGYGLSCPKKYKIEELGYKLFLVVCSIYSVSEVLETQTSTMKAKINNYKIQGYLNTFHISSS